MQAVIGRARLVRIALLSVIVLLGGYKFAVALSTGHTNVAFLVISAIIGVILAIWVSGTNRLSRRGRDYLKELQARMRGGKNPAGTDLGIESPNLTFLVAIFGFGALQGTAYAPFSNVLAPPRSSYSDNYINTGGCGGGGAGWGGCGGGN